ncbi:hypothetical protein G7Y89_g11801 [Cudoniella acicularis]|uniref:Uncharacterized protein n=1 Tax=Cudoniella acicularis TaxID=354080 RepID=A0A8H4RA63_9HELO|nr:hypothetical protein G7Y89_g11801 [Cudoniella acicularis]
MASSTSKNNTNNNETFFLQEELIPFFPFHLFTDPTIAHPQPIFWEPTTWAGKITSWGDEKWSEFFPTKRFIDLLMNLPKEVRHIIYTNILLSKASKTPDDHQQELKKLVFMRRITELTKWVPAVIDPPIFALTQSQNQKEDTPAKPITKRNQLLASSQLYREALRYVYALTASSSLHLTFTGWLCTSPSPSSSDPTALSDFLAWFFSNISITIDTVGKKRLGSETEYNDSGLVWFKKKALSLSRFRHVKFIMQPQYMFKKKHDILTRRFAAVDPRLDLPPSDLEFKLPDADEQFRKFYQIVEDNFYNLTSLEVGMRITLHFMIDIMEDPTKHKWLKGFQYMAVAKSFKVKLSLYMVCNWDGWKEDWKDGAKSVRAEHERQCEVLLRRLMVPNCLRGEEQLIEVGETGIQKTCCADESKVGRGEGEQHNMPFRSSIEVTRPTNAYSKPIYATGKNNEKRTC